MPRKGSDWFETHAEAAATRKLDRPFQVSAKASIRRTELDPRRASATMTSDDITRGSDDITRPLARVGVQPVGKRAGLIAQALALCVFISVNIFVSHCALRVSRCT